MPLPHLGSKVAQMERNYAITKMSYSINLPLAKSSSSFLFVAVAGSFATNAGLALACSAAYRNINICILFVKFHKKCHQFASLHLPGSPQ